MNLDKVFLLSSIPKKDRFLFLSLIILVIALPLTIFLAKKSQDIRPRAEANLPSLSLTAPDVTNLVANQQFTVRLFLDPKQKQVSGFEAHLSYPANVLEPNGTPIILISGEFPILLQSNIQNGNIDLAAGIALPTTTPTSQRPTCTEGLTVANKTPQAGIYTVSKGETISLHAQRVTDATNVRFAYKPTSVNACPPNSNIVLIDPIDSDYTDGFNVSFNTSNLSPGDYDFWATPRNAQNIGCSGNPSASSGNNFCGVGSACENCKTIIRIMAPTNTPIPPTATITPGGNNGLNNLNLVKFAFAQVSTPMVVANISFKVKSTIPAGVNSVTIGFRDTPPSLVTEVGNSQNVLGTKQNLNISLKGGTETLTPKIAFKFKFRGLNKDAGTQKIKVKVKKGLTAAVDYYADIEANHLENGVYSVSGLELTGVTPGEAKIYVKGPKHLAKGFEVNLVAGVNAMFDWTINDNDWLEPGDLRIQDGKINASDISRLVDLLSVEDPTDEDLETGDLNYDGVINGADVNELILTLSTKYDEDQL